MNPRKLLFPVSIVYGAVTFLRNFLYDSKILKEHAFDVPVIGVGNLNTGGTGKTPHVEYLIRLLKGRFSIAALSRGYGRSTKGYLLAKANMTAAMIGDEPMQYFQKFPEITVSVCESRAAGIKKILASHPGTDIIILDDAFQHRAVKAGLNILLTDYFDLFIKDFLLPAGNLREPKAGYKRAGLIVVTKCPELSGSEKEQIIQKINPHAHQQVLFSYLRYETPVPFSPSKENIAFDQLKETAVLLITGIAYAYQIISILKANAKSVQHLSFSDHHEFTKNDLLAAQKIFNNIAADKKIMLTTEKDGMRLRNKVSNEIIEKLPFYYLPVQIEFDDEDKKIFDTAILKYAGKN